MVFELFFSRYYLKINKLGDNLDFGVMNYLLITVPPTVGPNSQVKEPLRRLGFCLTDIWVSSKNSEIKYSTDGPLRKFKNLAKKLSDFDKNLTTQKTICVDLLVKISSKSDNFLAKFLL